MAGRIITIGEAVLDIIFRNRQPQRANPGGSMLNAAVSLGRSGLPVQLISEIGNDQAGELIADFLAFNRVGTDYIRIRPGIQTPLALAFLDEKMNACYDFYRSAEPEESQPAWNFPRLQDDDIFLFGSYFPIMPARQADLAPLWSQVDCGRFLTVYDPNFRSAHRDQLPQLRPIIISHIARSHLVKGSTEDFELVFGETNPESVYRQVSRCGCRCLILTAASNPVRVFTPTIRLSVPVSTIPVVSTIGAGDNFNAGLIDAFYRKHVTCDDLENLSAGEWEDLILPAIGWAREVCQSMDNYISAEKFGVRLN